MQIEQNKQNKSAREPLNELHVAVKRNEELSA